VNDRADNPLRQLPSVSTVLDHSGVRKLVGDCGRAAVVGWVRDVLDAARREGIGTQADRKRGELLEELAGHVIERGTHSRQLSIGPVVNATGVILHTGLGRAPLCTSAREALVAISGAGNVEIDLHSNERRHRGHQLQATWKSLTGCEDSLIVNNNAAATLLTLQALCAGREVIISRGQLIEIGGSFRLPEVFELSGARLKEVGTTNRTRLSDYERAIGPETAAILVVHPSNYRIVGFAETPGIDEIVKLAHAHGLIAIDDIGSGCLVDVVRYGLPAEPTFRQSLEAGCDVVLGSGDKLLGGPQAGIVLGATRYIEPMRRHPLARTLRVGKLTLAALSATLDVYRRATAEKEIPTLRLLEASPEELRSRCEAIEQQMGAPADMHMKVRDDRAPVGGGSLPGVDLPTCVIALRHAALSAEEFSRKLRTGQPRLVGRIQHDEVLIDLRSVVAEDDTQIVLALKATLDSLSNSE